MEDLSQTFLFMVDCLKKFNYPNIYGMDESEIKDIFSISNRQFLVSWILKQVDKECTEIVEEASKEDIAEIICCHGFCSVSEKERFMNGTVDEFQQFKILYKMFNFLKTVSDSKQIDQPSTPVKLEDINEMIQFDTNLFPMYGQKQTLDSKERAKRIKEYCKEIEDIKNLLSTKKHTESSSINTEMQQKLQSSIDNLERNFPDFKRQALDVIKSSNLPETEKTLFGDTFEQTLEACTVNVKAVLEFLQNTNVLMNFNEKTTQTVGDDSKTLTMMTRIATLCNEITALKNECDSGDH